jgi:hypothetical protein
MSLMRYIVFSLVLLIPGFLDAAPPQVFQGKVEGVDVPSPNFPSLLKPEDLVATRRKTGKTGFSTAEFGRLTPAELTREVLNSYRFFGDFEEEDAPRTPPNWIKISENPFDALALGEPPRLARSRNVLELPLFRLVVLNHFSGNDPASFHLNSAIDFWNQGLLLGVGAERTSMFQAASESFVEFERVVFESSAADEETLAKKGLLNKKSRHKAEQELKAVHSAGWALRGFFYLHIQAEREKIRGREEEGLSEKNPLQGKNLTNMVRASFQRALELHSPESLLQQFSQETLDGKLLSTLFDCPFYEEDAFLTVPPPTVAACAVRLSTGVFEPIRWLRSVSLALYWNLLGSQRIKGFWEKAFEAGDQLNQFSAHLPASFKQKFRWPSYLEGVGPVVPLALPVVSSPVRLWPRRLADLEGAGFLMQSYYSFLQNDPLEVLKTATRGIQRAESHELFGLGLHLGSLAYFDLNNFKRARQAAAWCEAVSESFVRKVPACLFLGAEAAFWMGDLDTAERGFRRFQSITGDSEYGPWADYRLLGIRHLRLILARNAGPSPVQREMERAVFVEYDLLARKYPDHAVANFAAVRAFCSGTTQGFLDGKALNAASDDLRLRLGAFRQQSRARAVAQLREEVAIGREPTESEILEALDPAGRVLEQDAEACLLSSSLGLMFEKSGVERPQVRNEAGVQIEAINRYRASFPESPYLPLFQSRYRALNLARVLEMADSNRCGDLLTAYTAERDQLNSLQHEGKLYLRTLFWGDEERRIVGRCAALKGDVARWREIRNMSVPRDRHGKPVRNAAPKGQDGGGLEATLFAFVNAKEKRRFALELGRELVTGLDEKGWQAAIAELDKSGNDYVRNDAFWKGLALRALLDYELMGNSAEVAAFRRQFMPQLLREPARILASDVLCVWTIRASVSFDRRTWDTILSAQSAEQWLALVHSERVGRVDRCRKGMADTLLRASIDKPSPRRDSDILLPYLEKRGMREAGDEWLGYAQRLATTLGSENRRVRETYRRLVREGSPLVQQSAKAWLEANIPAN